MWGWGGLAKALSAVKKSAKKVVTKAANAGRQAVAVVKSKAKTVKKRAVVAVKKVKTRIVTKVKKAMVAVKKVTKQAKSRVAALKPVVVKRAAITKVVLATRRSAVVTKTKAAAAKTKAAAARYVRSDQYAEHLKIAQTGLNYVALVASAVGIVMLFASGAGAPAAAAWTAGIMTGLSMSAGTARKQVDSTYSNDAYITDMTLGTLSVVSGGAASGVGKLAQAGGYADDVVRSARGSMDVINFVVDVGGYFGSAQVK